MNIPIPIEHLPAMRLHHGPLTRVLEFNVLLRPSPHVFVWIGRRAYLVVGLSSTTVTLIKRKGCEEMRGSEVPSSTHVHESLFILLGEFAV